MSKKETKISVHPSESDEAGKDPFHVQTKMHGMQPSSDLSGAGETTEYSTKPGSEMIKTHTTEGKIPHYRSNQVIPQPRQADVDASKIDYHAGENMLDASKQREIAAARDLKKSIVNK